MFAAFHNQSPLITMLKGTPTWRFHTKLYKFRLTVFPNISHLKYFTDLILGKGFCIFIFFHFPDSSPSVLNGLHFYFSLHDSASRELLKNYSKIWLPFLTARLCGFSLSIDFDCGFSLFALFLFSLFCYCSLQYFGLID